MKRTQRGAARISLVWMIAVIVMFFVAVGMAFVAFQDKSKMEDQRDKAQDTAGVADQRLAEESEKLTALSRSVGWYDSEAIVPRTDVEAMSSSLDDLRGAYTDLGPEVETLEQALPVVSQAFKVRGTEIAQLQESITTLESEKSTLEQSLRDAIRSKDAELANVQRQLADDANNAAQKQAELESRIDALRTQNSDLDSTLRQVRADQEDLQRQQNEERSLWLAREAQNRKVLAFTKEPERPDATILEVSEDLPLGWIDIGTTNRLARGTRFRVVSGEFGSDRVKAWAEVTDVRPNMAQVRFYDLEDRFNPVTAGDKVFNPVYDPVGERRAVLLGRFSGRYNEKELRVLLENMGILVQDGLEGADYVIVGSEMYVDEDGEPQEDPIQPSELPTYKDAEAQGILIVPLKSLYSYFKY